MPEPLYRVQARALVDEAAAREAAERYAASVEPSYGSAYSKKFLARLAFWYLVGLRGQPEPRRTPTNFERPLHTAWGEGRRLRHLLLEPGKALNA